MKESAAIQPLLALLRMALWERPEAFDPVSDAQWLEVLAESRRQAVAGLVCSGIGQLDKSLMPSTAVRISFLAELDTIEKRSAYVEKVADRLVAMFRSKGFSPVVQKGPAIARLYPHPMQRSSGDIDLYFNLSEFKAAQSMVESDGIQVNGAPDGSINYIWNNVTVEHHREFFDSPDMFKGVEVPSAEADMLLLSSHILKHAVGSGIGLKQFCDMAVACSALDGRYDLNGFLARLEDAHLVRWQRMLDTFLLDYLGVEERFLPTLSAGMKRMDAAPLLKIVLSGGNFGHYHPARHTDAAEKVRKRSTFMLFVRRFPFAMKVAPREWLRIVSSLTKGNLRH